MDEIEMLALESYIGRTPILEEVVKTMQALKDAYAANPNMDVTNSPYNKKIAALFKKQFGFKDVWLSWFRLNILNTISNTLNSPNELDEKTGNPTGKMKFRPDTTINASIILDVRILFDRSMKNDIDPKSLTRGYYDTQHKNILEVEISYAFLLGNNFTAEEIVAIIIHEIGHNFDDTPYSRYNMVLQWVDIVEVWMGDIGNIRKIIKKDPKTLEKLNDVVSHVSGTIISTFMITGGTRQLRYTLNQMLSTILDIVPFGHLLDHIGVGALRIIDAVKGLDPREFAKNIAWTYGKYHTNPFLFPLDQLSYVIVKKKEIFADSFAFTYGFGPALSTALAKVNESRDDDVNNALRKMPVLNILADIKMLNLYLISSMLSPGHGSGLERMHKLAEITRKELRNPYLDPNLRKQLEDEVTRIENEQKKFMNRTLEDRLYMTAGFQYVLVNVLGGNAFLIDRLLPDVYA